MTRVIQYDYIGFTSKIKQKLRVVWGIIKTGK